VIAANGTFPVWPENPAFTFRVIFWNRTEQSLLPVGPARLLRGGNTSSGGPRAPRRRRLREPPPDAVGSTSPILGGAISGWAVIGA
jgi:hypothetical protein